MKCDTPGCGSTEHFRAQCPMNQHRQHAELALHAVQPALAVGPHEDLEGVIAPNRTALNMVVF